MLRTKTKEKLNTILELQLQVHQKGIMQQNQILPETLADCQQTAIAVGERLEKELPDRTDLVEKLEQYCEELYQFSRCNSTENCVARLDTLIIEVKDQLAQIPAVYQAVFMPYKAEMWDSLESVWMAFDKDESCEALVMPLPYSKFDAQTQQWNPCYEGDRFPEYVPITDYREYHPEEEYPEFIFIHNPYDEYNRVTRINPEYFSYELKKYTGTLVYIPYYIMGGFISENHKMLSVYRSMDYMIVQSELCKSGLKEMFYYNKVLPFGSPKLDRVIRLCQGEKRVPEEWKKTIGDKKCIMLNTGLSYFLRFGERYLRKLRSCMEWIRCNPIVSLIWRPHPLFESTICSLRPELLEMYRDLVQFFLKSGIGVLDQTADIANTIALVDAYIGDGSSSVVNQFGAAGRPMFILDAARTSLYTEKEQRRISVAGIAKVGDKIWITAQNYNGLLTVEEDWDQVKYVHRLEGQPHWSNIYGDLLVIDSTIYLSPVFASEPKIYKEDMGSEDNMGYKGNGSPLIWEKQYVYKDRIFYLSKWLHRFGIYEYRVSDGTWTSYTDFLGKLTCNCSDLSGQPCVLNSFYDQKRYLWITAVHTNNVLRFDFETCKYKIYQVGPENYGYTGICLDGDILYLGEGHGCGKLLEVNLKTNTIHEHSIPNTGCVWRSFYQVESALGKIIDVGRYLVIAPGYSNRMWRFEKTSGDFMSMAEDFWDKTATESDNYFPAYDGACNLFHVFADRPTILWAQRAVDDAILILDVESGEYEVKYMYLSKESYARLMAGEDGFQKIGIAAPFVQTESRFFSLDDFVRKVAGGELEEVKKRQKEELSTLAANMDGTCGEKVHEYLKEVTKAGKVFD